MGCKTRAVHRVFQCVCFMLLHLFCTAQDEMRLSCRTAPSELVFILDGSWSVDDINFEIVKRWLVNITTSFKIGEKFTQVGVVQYSDNPILHIPLGNPYSSEELIKQMENIEYMGGNTRTGTAIQFATEKLFVTSKRGSKRTARIAVVLTDGKSQDEVAEAAEAARHQGVILFAIGVGAQTEELELKAIANKPSSTYVFYVEDYKAMSKIREVIRQKLCEEIVCPAKISVDSRDEKGFDLLMFLNLAKKGKKTQGSYYGTKAYEVSPRVDLSMSTRWPAPFLRVRLHAEVHGLIDHGGVGPVADPNPGQQASDGDHAERHRQHGQVYHHQRRTQLDSDCGLQAGAIQETI